MFAVNIGIIILASVGIGMGIWDYRRKKFRTVTDLIWMLTIVILGLIAISHAAICLR